MQVVTAGIIEKDDKILIAKRQKGKYLESQWEFPGGKLEPGETPQECLRRELMEELNIDTKIGAFFTSNKFFCNNKEIELLAYKVSFISGDIKLNDHLDAKWVKLEELKNFDFVPADKKIVHELLNAVD